MKTINKLLLILAICAGCIAVFTGCATSTEPEEEFIVSLDSPFVVIGEIDVQFMRPLSLALRRENITVLYFPHDDAVCLRFRLDFITYHQFWSRSGRQAFLNALAQYNQDFDDRNLPNSRRSRQTYGSVKGFLTWQQFDLAVRARANMNVDLGFDFRERLPYFTITQGRAEFINPNIPQQNRTSQVIPIFFTRAQAAELAALFEQHHLRQFEQQNVRIPAGLLNIDREDGF